MLFIILANFSVLDYASDKSINNPAEMPILIVAATRADPETGSEAGDGTELLADFGGLALGAPVVGGGVWIILSITSTGSMIASQDAKPN